MFENVKMKKKAAAATATVRQLTPLILCVRVDKTDKNRVPIGPEKKREGNTENRMSKFTALSSLLRLFCYVLLRFE